MGEGHFSTLDTNSTTTVTRHFTLSLERFSAGFGRRDGLKQVAGEASLSKGLKV